MTASRPSWGRYPETSQRTRCIAWRDEIAALAQEGPTLLAIGNQRSYGDSAHNDGAVVANLSRLDRFIAFDASAGVMRCEAGVTIGDILRVALPRGWGLPAIPGTQHVTVAGAIAHDVHGKNHGFAGTFGGCVREIVLWRSSDGFVACSPSRAPALFAATVAGMGLTGAIVEVELQLRAQASTELEMETIAFGAFERFLEIAALSEAGWEYTVAWVDGLARGQSLGRGVFFRANPAPRDERAPRLPAAQPRAVVPFELPSFVLSAPAVRVFNAAYRVAHHAGKRRVGFAPFFFPLDALGEWNRIYGRRGFLQHQCVVPMGAARDVVPRLLREIARAGEASFLSVLKTFGPKPSPGMLSFPREGVTLAMDFPMRGRSTLELLDRLDALVCEAAGAIYPAKDARMSAATFRRSFPRLDEFRPHVDARFSSSLWRRVEGGRA